ncbi:MAG: molybdopterin-guanine dinucleotide biosynthesis protein MobB [Candidatus Eisenbacteria sp.]|nr:molybdopterin-guanine dinucleotide biosynthesis protein MobB [Candidatus Eisenbacteria bacterium]
MPVVGITGRSSGVGKTQFIEKLLGVLPGASVLKVTIGERHAEPRIVRNKDELLTPGKDTSRYLHAGAGTVVWISCRREDLPSTLPRAMEIFGSGLILVESNSAVESLDPEIVVFVEGEADSTAAGRGSPKDQSLRIRFRADFVTSEPFDNFDLILDRIKEVMDMSEDRARELIKERAKDNRLACAVAFKICEETGITKLRIGEIINEMDVRIATCQLGCFP